MDDSDGSLVRRCQAGDAEAFGILVRKYAGQAVGLASVLMGSQAEAHDVSQEAFVRAWRHIRGFRGDTTFFRWYCSILRKVCWTWLRRHRRTMQPLPEETLHADGVDPSTVAEQNEDTQRLWRAILGLSPTHREIVVLSHFQGLSYREIAEVLEIPAGTVMSRLHAAREALKKRLTGVAS
jgi:RNA polymerase sigma-70 factor (ECF subfamily)